MSQRASYPVVDTLYLWYLGRPERPIWVGDLNLVMSGRAVSLRYSPTWLQTGFPLSEDLPLVDMEHLPRGKDSAAGAVDDACPDRWGERVIRQLERPTRLSLLEMLFFAGDDRFGALGVSTSAKSYTPLDKNPLPQLADVDAVHELVRKVLSGERIDEAHRRLIAPGATMGGTRPKALIQMEGAQWVLKFAEEDTPSEPLMEHAAMTLAATAGITVAQTRPIKLARGVAVAIKRFDRANKRRLHAISANVALKAAGSELSYPYLAQLLRRRGVTEGGVNREQMHELFRRLIFNILIDNTDDHEKNHVLIVNDAQNYVLSPAFDVLPTRQALGYQGMAVGVEGAVSSVDNALSMCASYWLSRKEALTEATRVAKVVNHWRTHFKAAGVDEQTIGFLADQIDRPQLLEQRRALTQ
jgi:serine/threonine-protein kinase HipA